MGKEQHCACFETLCLYPDYTLSHIDKIFMNKHALKYLFVCVMTSTDNIIDVVVMCICMIICQQVNSINKMSRYVPAKAPYYQCLFIGVNIVVIA